MLNALYFGFFISAAFATTAVNSTFFTLLIPVGLLTITGCYVVFTGDGGAGLPVYMSLSDKDVEQLIKSGRSDKGFGLNSETYI